MPGQRRTMEGVVVSDKMQKTVVVAIDRWRPHRLYKKVLRRTRRFKAHDEENACRLGDRVLVEESRPLSGDKRWRVVQVLTRGQALPVAPEGLEAPILGEEDKAGE